MSALVNPNNSTPLKGKYQASRDEINALNPPEQSSSSDVASSVGAALNQRVQAGQGFDQIYSASKFASGLRGNNLPPPSPTTSGPASASFSTSSSRADWRVKLSIPQQFATDGLLAPLVNAGGAFVFPYTPTIIVGHSASYNSLQPVHSNFPFQIYESSNVQEIVITGDFTVENAAEGQYWVAAMHYLRSVTKMFYGDSANAGSPPPIVKLNGYGDYVFNNIPCVVTNFTIDLPSDVDYVAVPMDNLITGLDGITESSDGKGVTWVPTQSLMTVTVQPTYSRKTVSQFNLNDFVNGKFIRNNTGFI